MATTFFGLLFDTDVTLLDRAGNISSAPVVIPETADILPYLTRIIVNQSANASATITVKYISTETSQIVTDTNIVNSKGLLDKKYDVMPNTNVEISVEYETGKFQTKFGSASINGNPIFVNDQINDTVTLKTSLTKSTNTSGKTIENRGLIIRDITENKTVYVNLVGIVEQTSQNTETFAKYNIEQIKVSNKNL